MKHSRWALCPLLLFLFLIAFFWRGLALNPQELPSAVVGKQLPDFSLPELFHLNQSVATEAVRGRVALLNVWASWCSACIDEQVMLLALAREGVLIYGLNYKDNPKDAKRWLKEWGNPYQLVMQDRQGRATMDLGVYGAPETFVLDKQGYIRYRHAGGITKALWQEELAPLLKALEAEK